MAKDPRFNFYPDNWAGGTKRMNFMQKGAYLELLILNYYCFTDGLPGFTEQEAASALVSATAYAELWTFLKPKFKTDGHFFYSERLRKEFHKSKKNSEEQSKRATRRWENNSASNPASLTVLPVNGNGIGIGNSTEEKGVQGENFSDAWFADIFKPELIKKLKDSFSKHNVENEIQIFQLKVRGSPDYYANHGRIGIWRAMIYQLQNSTATNGHRITNQGTTQPTTTAIIEPGKDFGVKKGFSRSGANGGGNGGSAKSGT
jgi:uncharacterized protein YdaU (DUF1376 family)